MHTPLSDLRLSLIVPAYNEEHRLERQHEAFDYLPRNWQDYEIIYVDDGSTDGTYQHLIEFQQQFKRIKVLQHKNNQGKGKAVRTGLKAATGDLLLLSDVDFSTPMNELGKLMFALDGGADVAIGSRGVEGSNVEIHQSFFRESIGKIGNAIVQSALLLPFEDTQCGFKLYRRHVITAILPKLTIDGFAFDMEMLLAATSLGYSVAEVPVTWRDVPKSKVRLFHVLEVLKDVLRIRYRFAIGSYS